MANAYRYNEAYYEGSPGLGYASKDQVAEFVESKAAEAEAEQLFSTRDPAKTAQFGAFVFNRMLFASGMYREGYYGDSEPGPIVKCWGGDEVIAGTKFEVGLVDENMNVMVNLDYLERSLKGDGWTGYHSARIPGKAGSLVMEFIEERRRFMGIEASCYAHSGA